MPHMEGRDRDEEWERSNRANSQQQGGGNADGISPDRWSLSATPVRTPVFRRRQDQSASQQNQQQHQQHQQQPHHHPQYPWPPFPPGYGAPPQHHPRAVPQSQQQQTYSPIPHSSSSPLRPPPPPPPPYQYSHAYGAPRPPHQETYASARREQASASTPPPPISYYAQHAPPPPVYQPASSQQPPQSQHDDSQQRSSSLRYDSTAQQPPPPPPPPVSYYPQHAPPPPHYLTHAPPSPYRPPPYHDVYSSTQQMPPPAHQYTHSSNYPSYQFEPPQQRVSYDTATPPAADVPTSAAAGGAAGHAAHPSSSQQGGQAAPPPDYVYMPEGAAAMAEQRDEQFIFDIGDNDVLCGRGAPTTYHPGNQFFKELVAKYQPTYIASRRSDKPQIATQIVQIIRERGGRFLKRTKKPGLGPSGHFCWEDVGDQRAYEKACQALRENAPEIRRRLASQELAAISSTDSEQTRDAAVPARVSDESRKRSSEGTAKSAPPEAEAGGQKDAPVASAPTSSAESTPEDEQRRKRLKSDQP